MNIFCSIRFSVCNLLIININKNTLRGYFTFTHKLYCVSTFFNFTVMGLVHAEIELCNAGYGLVEA
jgi:hypothetical protein